MAMFKGGNVQLVKPGDKLYFDDNHNERRGGNMFYDDYVLYDSISEDMVNHPSHYTSGSIECIDAMIETQGTEAVKQYCKCNAFKYLWRHSFKNGEEDIDKAIWYLNKYVELRDGIKSEEIFGEDK